ncbi:hypothetical protein LZ554_008980 [Drepanopeziza brunnea f. sp. 'monogermtubi']|nr:hypothetical protein LZ554_008980 [Drepanopeziza brunnea f. sp. 'monogermtubi']
MAPSRNPREPLLEEAGSPSSTSVAPSAPSVLTHTNTSAPTGRNGRNDAKQFETEHLIIITTTTTTTTTTSTTTSASTHNNSPLTGTTSFTIAAFHILRNRKAEKMSDKEFGRTAATSAATATATATPTSNSKSKSTPKPTPTATEDEKPARLGMSLRARPETVFPGMDVFKSKAPPKVKKSRVPAKAKSYSEDDLGGIVYPGMGLFDSATAEMKWLRNQPKNPKLLQALIATSLQVRCPDPELSVWDINDGLKNLGSASKTQSQPQRQPYPQPSGIVSKPQPQRSTMISKPQLQFSGINSKPLPQSSGVMSKPQPQFPGAMSKPPPQTPHQIQNPPLPALSRPTPYRSSFAPPTKITTPQATKEVKLPPPETLPVEPAPVEALFPPSLFHQMRISAPEDEDEATAEPVPRVRPVIGRRCLVCNINLINSPSGDYRMTCFRCKFAERFNTLPPLAEGTRFCDRELHHIPIHAIDCPRCRHEVPDGNIDASVRGDHYYTVVKFDKVLNCGEEEKPFIKVWTFGHGIKVDPQIEYGLE